MNAEELGLKTVQVEVFLCMDRDIHVGTYGNHYDAYMAACQATEKNPPAYLRVDDDNGYNCMNTSDMLEYLARRSLGESK